MVPGYSMLVSPVQTLLNQLYQLHVDTDTELQMTAISIVNVGQLECVSSSVVLTMAEGNSSVTLQVRMTSAATCLHMTTCVGSSEILVICQSNACKGSRRGSACLQLCTT